MRASILRALALSTLLAASSAGADAPPSPRRYPARGALTLRLADVRPTRVERGVDGREVAGEVRSMLRARQSRLDACLANVELREDPLRRRQRSVSGSLVFERGARPASARVSSSGGAPAPARRCVEEVVSSIRLGRAPSGRVQLTYRYVVRR